VAEDCTALAANPKTATTMSKKKNVKGAVFWRLKIERSL
jgi:hypothetical protein